MTGWIILGIYVLGYLSLWRTVTFFLIQDLAYGKIDGESIIFGSVIGTLLSLFWPIILVGITMKRIYEGRDESVILLLTPRSQKRKLILAERERRIKELERELNIR